MNGDSNNRTPDERLLADQQQRLRASGLPILEVKIGGEAIAVPDWDAIQAPERSQLRALADRIGYGRCIQILEQEWSLKLQNDPQWPQSAQSADVAAGTICVWCHTDKRTGEVVKIKSRAKPRKVKR